MYLSGCRTVNQPSPEYDSEAPAPPGAKRDRCAAMIRCLLGLAPQTVLALGGDGARECIRPGGVSPGWGVGEAQT
jgi:hypothetical protein